MADLHDLVARARPAADAPPGLPLVSLSDGDSADAVVFGLVEYFGADDARQAVGLVVAGDPVGYLDRADLLDLIEVSARAIGAGEGALLPGAPDLHFLLIRCPVAGCTEQRLVMLFDEDAAPACPVHRGARLGLVP